MVSSAEELRKRFAGKVDKERCILGILVLNFILLEILILVILRLNFGKKLILKELKVTINYQKPSGTHLLVPSFLLTQFGTTIRPTNLYTSTGTLDFGTQFPHVRF